MKYLRIATLSFALTICFTMAGMAQAPVGPNGILTDVEIRKLLVDRIDVQHKSVGMVVGIVSPTGRRVVSYGRLAVDDPREPDGNTIFEIGSVTKILTTLILADMVERGEAVLMDPVSKYLPTNVVIPERGTRQITLLDLATHTSGLPFLPSDLPTTGPEKWAAYDAAAVYSFLGGYKLARDPGTKWEYSNLGVGLLGTALARRANRDFQSLLRERITSPLGLSNTSLGGSSKERVARGHDASLAPAPSWNLPGLIAAGSVRSTANDLLTLLSAFMTPEKSKLSNAMASMLKPYAQGPGLQQALGWWIIPMGAGDPGIVTHGGQTHGFSATVAFDPAKKIGVVVLSNASPTDDGLTWHLLRPAFPYATAAMQTARQAKQEIQVQDSILRRYVGAYITNTGDTLRIERAQNSLVFRSAAAPQGIRLRARTESSFFISEADMEVNFEVSGSGNAPSLTILFGGTSTRAVRIGVEERD